MDIELVKMYADYNCKKCYGRGTESIQTKNRGMWIEHLMYCKCVYKNMRKANNG